MIGGRKIQRDVSNDQVSRRVRNLRNVETIVLINVLHLLPLLLPATRGSQCPLRTLAIDDDQEILYRGLV